MSQAWAYLSGAAWRWTFQFIISCVFGDFNSKLTHFGEGDGVTNDIGEQYISIPQKFSYTPIGCIMVWCGPNVCQAGWRTLISVWYLKTFHSY